MRPTSVPFLAGLVALTVRADPTWPASTDDLEEIMYQLQGTGARLFSDVISPCTNEASGPGRQNAAEWLRVGFHDMATANTYFGTGGLDGSLQFELTNTENTGPGHATTLKFLGNYVSSRTSLADLIAAAVYASVRSCGGPVVPVRAGRQDATEAGNPGVPQPQNSIGIFTDQFDRMGFSVPEMIQVLACGHTLGGVHSPEFPDLVPANSAPDDEAALDTSVAVFDNKVVTEYLAGTTKNPLVVGPSARIGKNSDFKVFNADANATMATLADPATFMNTCKTVLQKMIDTVPSGVVLTADPVTPYAVKPVDLQLTLNPDGQTLLLSGYIRVRTTNLPASSISSLTLTYKDRNGGNDCGSCATTATVQGSAAGFDDTFAFFPIAANIDTSTGISSFTVALHLSDSTTQIYDNNGHSYPITDAVLLQTPQSCLLQGTGALTVSALVRNDRTSLPVTLGVTYPVPRNTPDQNPVPALQNATVSMTKGKCVGDYTFYTGTYTIPGGLSFNARVDVISGDGDDVQVDDFNDAGKLAGTCRDYTGVASCSGAGPTSGEPSSSPTGTPTTTPTPTDTPTSATSATPTATLSHREIIGGYTLVSCWTEGANVRALRGASFAYDGMTLESCMGNCSGFAYWGAEYGRECYCGNSLDASSAEAPLSECDMVCSGDATEYCGAGNRLELYSTTATQSPTPTPTATLAVKPTVGAYSFVGCITEGVGIRALSEDSYAADDMTLESCAAFCSDFTYFGTEYGRECR
ncbi:hypothetical protein VTK73DRAFT_3070 [Phialemonium thermophilum]|uniref:Uncharacterized protein n=1 Tax=Phialemonium thermophilum TaxID=223376 RepID=A0ABR3VLI5_9PEZI